MWRVSGNNKVTAAHELQYIVPMMTPYCSASGSLLYRTPYIGMTHRDNTLHLHAQTNNFHPKFGTDKLWVNTHMYRKSIVNIS